MKAIAALAAAVLLPTPFAAHAAEPLRPDQVAFRDLYRELVETNTVLGSGSCTLAASRMAFRLKAAGIPDSAITPFAIPDHPEEGGLVVVYPGRSGKRKSVLLLAHIDVVEAKREDWTRDPFKLVEDGGHFYARGAFDDKAQAAIWVDTLVRFARARYRPDRGVKLALTCGEETTWAFNGAEWLAANRRDLIDAAFALNEGGGGRTDGKSLVDGGKLMVQTLQVGEKAVQNYRLEVTNPGGHSSIPVRDNAIYRLADALMRLRGLDFPVELNATTRAFLRQAGAVRGGEEGAAMAALAADPADARAASVLDRDRIFHAMLRTTCVATLVDGGHANNALPQRAGANVNCRLLPGHSAEEVRDRLSAAIGDPDVKVTLVPPVWPAGAFPPLDERILEPATKLAAKYFPGVPLIPAMTVGSTDAIFLNAVGIPTYGVPGLWANPDGNGTHGLNERIEARALFQGRDYLFDLVKLLAD